jgi:hypothetical protein
MKFERMKEKVSVTSDCKCSGSENELVSTAFHEAI